MMPAIFIAHGAPMLLDDPLWVGQLAAWAAALPRPKAILMISAHWLQRPTTLGALKPVPLIYDFSGFAPHHYAVTYPCPGAPQLARRVRELLAPLGPVADQPDRGLDHGAYVPLVAMYPRADVPVLQMSLAGLEPAPLIALGRALTPLRDEGVLIAGSGFLTHNLGQLDFSGARAPAGWAVAFDAWMADALARRDVEALLAYRQRAPSVRIALPTDEHLAPVFIALGASLGVDEAVTFPITGFFAGSLSKRSLQFG